VTVVAIIVAAGRGHRVGGDIPKQYRQIAGNMILTRSIRAVLASDKVDKLCTVIHPDDLPLYKQALAPINDKRILPPVMGGDTRAVSVRNGLESLSEGAPQKVLIHDAARPFLSTRIIDELVENLDHHHGAFPVIPVADALWRANDLTPVDRDGLVRAQTPQAFRYIDILSAHRQGDPDIRVGQGYDVHAFTAGNSVTLNGVEIPHDRKLKGHSDADVAMHAITDAIYGALAEGDIGQWFPPSDPQWKGAASDIFLKHAVERVTIRGFQISHIDCTIVCEEPKIGPHAHAMREALKDLLGISMDRISVKATTSEKLGFTGRAEGISAHATATLVKS